MRLEALLALANEVIPVSKEHLSLDSPVVIYQIRIGPSSNCSSSNRYLRFMGMRQENTNFHSNSLAPRLLNHFSTSQYSMCCIVRLLLKLNWMSFRAVPIFWKGVSRSKLG